MRVRVRPFGQAGAASRRVLLQVLAPLNPPRRSPKPFTDPFTARAGGWLFLVFSAAEFYLGIDALFSGCIRTMRGRHGPSALHCAPDPWYRGHTAIALVLGVALAVVGWKLFQTARRARGSDPAGR